MDNKLSELSKPVAWSDERRNICTNTIKERGLDSKYRQDYEKYSTPLYSQEYVSALLAELEAKDERIGELERILDGVTPVMIAGGWTAKGISDYAKSLEARLATPVRFKVGTDSVDSDVSDRNQPGMVVAVHVDAGDFVKVKGQVYEVKEACFDDHDVTLWFVCGEVLKCAAGCQIEVVSAPEGEA